MRRWLLLLLLLLTAAAERRPGWIGLGFTAHRDGGEQWLIVRFVTPGSPAEHAGFRVNDVITRIDDKRFAFRNDLDLLEYLGRIKPGQRLRFTTIVRQRQLVREVTALEMSEEHYKRYKLNVAVARGVR